jgi:NADPH2 dehydrogenase
MARFFKFHSLADLEAECCRLGLDLRFSEDFAPLFRPVQLGPLRAGNSLCVQPMEGCDGTLDGRPDELTLRRYQRFGAGGAKLVWGEATAVVDEGRANPRQLLINEQTLPDLATMVRICRQAHREAWGKDDDLVVGLLLTHSGRYSYPRPLIPVHDPILDPRTILDRATGTTIGSDYPTLSDDYLKRLVDHYVVAAKLAFRAGYQFVDIKQCHRYLLSELLASKPRPGLYGGSLENRTRLARNIIVAIRTEVPGLVIASRVNVFDCIPYRKPERVLNAEHSPLHAAAGVPCPWEPPLTCAWGTDLADPNKPDLAEPLRWIGDMLELGVACINVSMGSPYTTPHVTRPFEYSPPDGYETPEHPLIGVDRHFRLAAEVQRAFPQVAIVGSGYSYLQEFLAPAGAANIRDGRITIVGVGRATLAQPDFVRQIQEHGKLDRKRICRTFSYCTALMRSKHNEQGQFATGCPPFDKEVYGPIWDEARRQVTGDRRQETEIRNQESEEKPC